MRIQPKPEETPITLAAKQTYLGRVYLDWAQYPVTETEQTDSSQAPYIVRFRDLRYDYPDQIGRGILGASVELDQNLKEIGERFGTKGPWVPAGPAKR
jgi:inner membrane protein